MTEYLYGAAVTYALATILLLNVTDPVDDSRPYAHIWFALGWPVMAIISIYEMIVYGSEGDK